MRGRAWSKAPASLYDAIADGLRTPCLKDRLLELEARQTQWMELIDQAPPPASRLHAKLAEVYAFVADLDVALSNPNAPTAAAEILRWLIDRIAERNDPHGDVVELTGAIVKLLTPSRGKHFPFRSIVC